MTKEEFIAEAKARGLPKDQVKAKYDQLVAQGAFDDASGNTLPPPVEPEESYTEAVGRKYAATDFQGTVDEYVPEVARRLQTRVQGGGDPTLTQMAATGVSQAARTGGELAVQAFVPLIPEGLKETLGDAWDVLKEAPYFQAPLLAVSSGFEAYQNWANTNPEEAKRFSKTLEETGTGVDIVTLFSPRPDLLNLDKKVRAAKAAGNRQKITKEKEALKGLLTPEKLDAKDKTVERGLLNTETWVPNEFDDSVIDVVQTIPGIKPFGTVHQNFRIIQNHVENSAKTLANYIKSQNKKIDPKELSDEFDLALDDFQGSDVYKLASEAAQKQFEKFSGLARQLILEEGTDLQGILRARKRFDEAMHAAGNTLDADVATYQAQAGKLVRGVMNDYLKRNTDGVEVHNLLDTQFRSLTALDRLVNKRNVEGKNAPARLMQRITETTGINIPTSVLSVLAIGTTAFSPTAGAAIGATAAVGYAGQQIARHGKTATLKAYAGLLSATDKAIKIAKKANDPAGLSVLEMDRMVLVEMMNEVRNYKEPKEDE